MLDRSYIDLTTPMGRGFMAFMSAMAEDERLRIIKRIHEGRQVARENDVKKGPKFRLSEDAARLGKLYGSAEPPASFLVRK